MSRTIKRGIPPRKSPPPRRKVAVKKVSTMDKLIGMLPVGEQTLHRIVTGAMLTAVAGAVIAGAAWLGIPGVIGTAVGEQVGAAGFRVNQIEVTGLKRMDRLTVYACALEEKQKETPMPLVDLAAIRGCLLRYGWIADAHVSRRLPNLLLVDIEERTPAAVWQDNGQLTLIDGKGVILEAVSPNAIPDLPLIIGRGADQQEAAYQALLAAAPALKPRVKAAAWIGNRRWDLTFDSGETLALPEDGAAPALVRFAELDGAKPLLGRGWLRFDMRDPTKLVARKPGTTLAHQVPDDGKGAPAPAPTQVAGATEG